MKSIKTSTIVMTSLILLLIVYIFILRYRNNNLKNIKDNYEAINDTLITYKNKMGQNVAKIQSLEEQNIQNILKIKTKDSSITKLQEIIKNHKQSIIVIYDEGETIIDTVFTSIVIPGDTIDNYIYATYISDINLNNWVTGKVTANKDFIDLNLSIVNKSSVVINKEKNKYYAIITEENPYSKTKVLRSAVTIPSNIKRWGIGPSIGLQYNIRNGTLQEYIGIGLQYNLIKF